jgi:hypothetical protein
MQDRRLGRHPHRARDASCPGPSPNAGLRPAANLCECCLRGVRRYTSTVRAPGATPRLVPGDARRDRVRIPHPLQKSCSSYSTTCPFGLRRGSARRGGTRPRRGHTPPRPISARRRVSSGIRENVLPRSWTKGGAMMRCQPGVWLKRRAHKCLGLLSGQEQSFVAWTAWNHARC